MSSKILMLALGATVFLIPTFAFAQYAPLTHCSISASPSSLGAPGPVTLTWNSNIGANSGRLIQIDARGDGNPLNATNVSGSGSTSVSLTANTTFFLTFNSPSALSFCYTQVNVGGSTPPPPTCSISLNPASIKGGSSSTLSWATTNATSFSINQGIGALNNVAGGSTSVFPTATTTYTGTVTGSGGTANCSGTIDVSPTQSTPVPACVLSANPSVIPPGHSSMLSWTTMNAASLSLNQGIGLVTPVAAGSKEVSPTATTTYTGTVTGTGGTNNCSAAVGIDVTSVPVPTCTLTVNPPSITSGNSSTLSWTTTNATNLSINQGLGSVTPLSAGSTSVSPTATTTYTGTVIGLGGTSSCSATLGVTTEQSQSVCAATSASTFGACIKEANKGEISEINVTAPILCDDSGNKCNFILSNITHSLLVTGESITSAKDCSGNMVSTTGFCRTGPDGGYASGSTLQISHSTGPITVQNLTFDDGTNEPIPFSEWKNPAVDVLTNLISPVCKATEPYSEGGDPCKLRSLVITDSQNVLVTNSSFLNSKSVAIQISGSTAVPTKSIWIRGNRIDNAFILGVYTSPNGVSGEHIENNTFANDDSSAGGVSGMLPDASDPLGWNTFTGNTITNSTNTSYFYGSNGAVIGGGSVGGDCAAGVICDHNWYENNLISDGGMPGTVIYQQDKGGNDGGYNGASEGFEFEDNAGADNRNLTVTHNYVNNQAGVAIEIDNPLETDDSGFQIYNNYFSNNDAVFGKITGDTQIINEWFLASGQNKSDSGQYPGSRPLWNSGSLCTQNTWLQPWDWSNCVSTTWIKPTGSLSVPSCSLDPSGTCSTKASWTGSGGPYTIVLNDASDVAKSASSGSQTVTLTSTPSCFSLYSSLTNVADVCVSGH